MKTFYQWLNDKYQGSYHAKELHDLKLDWIEETLTELIAALTPPAPVEERVIVWPPSPEVCKCGNFKSDGFVCDNCGGFLF